MMIQKRAGNPSLTSTKRHPENPGLANARPAKRQRGQTSAESQSLINEAFLQELYVHANNWKLRAEYAQEINEFLSLAYQGKVLFEEQDGVQKMLTPPLRDFFKKQDACRDTLQGAMHQTCLFLEERDPNKSPLELLHLLKQKGTSGAMGLRERKYDALDADEESLEEEQKSSNQTVLMHVFKDSSERPAEKRWNDLYESLSNAIEREKISDMTIEAWCSHKEAFMEYVSTFPSRVMALRKSHHALLHVPKNPGAYPEQIKLFNLLASVYQQLDESLAEEKSYEIQSMISGKEPRRLKNKIFPQKLKKLVKTERV